MRENCQFYQAAQGMGEETVARAFLDIYCKGPEENNCVIRDLADELGWGAVPDNMMPNGNPIPGTGGEEEWSDEVKGAIGL
ncbi:hypothetical protein AKJ65_03625 [candidate division MSBL1 archaeon SCGC-AAA259E19]|uniref:Uncharacterized protein n=1 Tax=candidate division MSBL1 archaeon SCGC-AAA259E19 TaxID=1698264 RepID=A0A133UKJ6_9EURY|nr:hypothetical protein AKJ65_03625 [candidate division MSBL1 archaeon SCGC-AAA259E19]